MPTTWTDKDRAERREWYKQHPSPWGDKSRVLVFTRKGEIAFAVRDLLATIDANFTEYKPWVYAGLVADYARLWGEPWQGQS